MTDHVLVPIDGSPLSFEALRLALTEFRDASVTALHVTDLFDPGYRPGSDTGSSYEPAMGSDEWHERVAERTDQLFEEVESIAADLDGTVFTESEIGDPIRVIVDYAEEEPVDHVVVGAHGRPAGNRPVFGRVAERVARSASVPVTIVR